MDSISNTEEFQKKKSFLMRKSHGKNVIENYRAMLEYLFSECAEEIIIIDLESSDLLRAKAAEKEVQTLQRIHTSFNNRGVLRNIVAKLITQYNSEVYFFCEYAEFCGIARIPSLECLHCDFEYNKQFPSIFWFYTPDMENLFVVDFGEEHDDLYLELEVGGKMWEKAMLESQ